MDQYSTDLGDDNYVPVAEISAENGHLDILKCMNSIASLLEPSLYSKGTRAGHLDIVKFLFKKTSVEADALLSDVAAEEGQIEVFKWALKKEFGAGKADTLAAGGHIEILKYMHELTFGFDPDTCSSAAQNGHLEIIKWWRANGYNWNERIEMVTRDDLYLQTQTLDVYLRKLEVLIQHGIEWDKADCLSAAFMHSGDGSATPLEVSKLLLKNGAPWTPLSVREAFVRS